MRALLLATVLVGCRAAPEAKPPPNEALRMAFVYGAPGEKDFSRAISVQTWASPAPSAGEHWTVVDAQGFVADVVITEPEPGECDHCPTHRMLARVVEHRGNTGSAMVAIGPATGPLRHARITRSDSSSHSHLSDDRYTFELEVDADGDGLPDLARWVRGPRVEYEIRARIGGVWSAREHWMTDDILDVQDKCPDAPEDYDADSGCPPPAAP